MTKFENARLKGVALLCLFGILLSGAPLVYGEAAPEWEVETETGSGLFIAGVSRHAKDYGWLLTFRLKLRSKSIAKPVSHVILEAYDRDEELLWDKRHLVRRRDFEGDIGGGSSQFVRVLLKDLPEETAVVRLSYGAETED